MSRMTSTEQGVARSTASVGHLRVEARFQMQNGRPNEAGTHCKMVMHGVSALLLFQLSLYGPVQAQYRCKGWHGASCTTPVSYNCLTLLYVRHREPLCSQDTVQVPKFEYGLHWMNKIAVLQLPVTLRDRLDLGAEP